MTSSMHATQIALGWCTFFVQSSKQRDRRVQCHTLSLDDDCDDDDDSTMPDSVRR